MTCTTEHDLCVTRGSKAEHTCRLRSGFDEVIEAPLSYRGRLIFRETQDDFMPNLLVLTVAPEIVEEAGAPGEKSVVFQFEVAGSLTATLPEYDIVAFVELQHVGVDTQRLYNMRVRMGD